MLLHSLNLLTAAVWADACPTDRWPGNDEADTSVIHCHMAVLVIHRYTGYEAAGNRERRVTVNLHTTVPNPTCNTPCPTAALPNPAALVSV